MNYEATLYYKLQSASGSPPLPPPSSSSTPKGKAEDKEEVEREELEEASKEEEEADPDQENSEDVNVQQRSSPQMVIIGDAVKSCPVLKYPKIARILLGYQQMKWKLQQTAVFCCSPNFLDPVMESF